MARREPIDGPDRPEPPDSDDPAPTGVDATTAQESEPPGRRWPFALPQRRTLALVGAAVLLVVSVPLVLGAAAGPERSTDAAVPAEIYQPRPWQAPVQQSPAGSAAVLFSGKGGGTGGGSLPGTYGSKVGVVGRDGSYRVLRYATSDRQVAQEVLLSPDGRYVAGDGSEEDPIGMDEYSGAVSVVDLVTGRTRRFAVNPGDRAVAWRPDGGALVLWNRGKPSTTGDEVAFDGHEVSYGYGGGTLRLMELGDGRLRTVANLDIAPFDPVFGVAFTPDGKQLAYQNGQRLHVVDMTVDGPRRPALVNLDAGERLAGAGAFTPDGARFAVVSADGWCLKECSGDARNARTWKLRLRDTATGALVPGTRFASVGGAALRIAGWYRDGTAVAVRYRVRGGDAPQQEPPTAYRSVRGVELLALPAVGGQQRLLRTPRGEVYDLDVARDLILNARFGGAAPVPGVVPVAPWIVVVSVTVLLGAAATGWLAWRVVRRGQRREEPAPAS
ncbi:WD40 repeat domain-containing protein [Virgisporangium aliadipatigenens]|uniref:WD40 repeat domain-containing protein n=1 Tax=Virgisporangium aliadipatigenens TaxID=741659 RepID=UPI001942C705|nr:WD40 repeat domain-containing protein [Virgisporangium aliadipatigenens]